MLCAQSDEFRFKRISSKVLSSSSINDILQDSHGFIWFATDDGLHRWDGYKIKSFYHNPEDNNSLSSSAIASIYEDTDSVLWIGAGYNGLNRYNRNLENFTRYDIGNINPDENNQNIIWEICEDQNHNLWIATSAGLIKFDRTNGEFKRYSLDSTSFDLNVSQRAINAIRAVCKEDDNTLLLGTRGGLAQFDLKNKIFTDSPFNQLGLNQSQGISGMDIRDIYKENSGIFWIATTAGFYRYEPINNLVINYLPVLTKAVNINGAGVNSISASSSGDLWFGTWHGLYSYDKSSDHFNAFFHNSRDPASISSSAISRVYADKADNLWIGTDDRGVSLLPNRQRPFKSYNWDSENSNSLGHGRVMSICEDKDGHIWIGTWGGGVSHYNPEKGIFTHYTTQSPSKRRIRSNYINVIHQDKDEDIWIGSTGIDILDLKTGNIQTIDEMRTRRIRNICKSKNGDLWIAFKYSGFARYNRSENSFSYFLHKTGDSLSLSNDRIACIYEDTSGRLWVGTVDGLNRLDNPRSEKPEFIQYHSDPANPNSISSNIVDAIYEDGKGRMWIGTSKGLNLFDIETNRFTAVNIIEGSTNNIIQKIIEDDHGNLWIRWGEELVRYNPDTGDTRVYDERDEFIPEGQHGRFDQVLYRGKSGTMYYGGVNRFVAFDPDRLKDNPVPPPIVITNFLLHNKSVDIGKDSPLKESITETKLIELPYNKNILSFEFAALDYTNPSKNQYAYKMTGVDGEWVYTDATRRYANYTNLDPGKYIFSVKASNSDGIWKEEAKSIMIVIAPPWWKTWWAYTIYACLLFGLIYFLRRYELNRQRLKHNWELKQVEAEKYQEIDRMKSRFFANISHEFRTPLTLIKGPVQQMLSGNFKGNIEKQYKIILRNTNRLMQLINQLLDLSKLESGQMTLRTSPVDVVPLLKGLTHSFESLAKQKNITLNFRSCENHITIYMDREKFEKIIINLLSNAFKFTPEGGNVIVDIPPSKGGIKGGMLEIRVKNTGTGIPPDQLDKIFDRFYQIDDSLVRKQEGSGIGLALTKELVELHHGKIKVESEPGEGTTFTIHLPLGKEHLLPEEIVTESPEITTEPQIDSFVTEPLPSSESKVETTSKKRAKDYPTLLIVEDNSDMRQYMRGCLESNLNIREAENGEVGLEQALKYLPNLIISDVMMPKMDGFQFCSKIKTDERTSHIPVILLTAKASGESKIEGLETGADDYLTKPFDTRELQVRVKNLIEQRRQLQEKFRREFHVEPRDITITSIDEQILQRAIDAVENNISSPEFDTPALAREVGMSRMLLHTKLKALTGQSTGEFIRTLRLKRAAQLLQKGYGNVTQVAYDVGFQNLSYFAKTFRQQFGQSPSNYSPDSENNSG